MCEANAYILKNGQEELMLESVDIIEPEGEGGYRMVNIFGEQKIVQGKIRLMNLVNHKIVFEEYS
ncbi:MAG: CooT family nickel-binding protein [Deltaproteobacteria bacterium]|jgi:predicted RNA-binding protein|nr:CooT family nickel-binding protein [Deltaproteobacteria bacterium]